MLFRSCMVEVIISLFIGKSSFRWLVIFHETGILALIFLVLVFQCDRLVFDFFLFLHTLRSEGTKGIIMLRFLISSYSLISCIVFTLSYHRSENLFMFPRVVLRFNI